MIKWNLKIFSRSANVYIGDIMYATFVYWNEQSEYAL